MIYRLTDEERHLQRVVRDFAEQVLAPLVPEAERLGRFPRAEVLPRMAELGLLSIGVPEALGGAGGSSMMFCVVAEELARVCGGFAIAVMAPVLAPAALVAMTGGGGAAATFLEPLLSGQVLPALAFTEPGGGSDLAGLRTTATRAASGRVLDGSKCFITGGPTADVFLVAAVRSELAAAPRDERARGLGLHVVLRGAPGLDCGPPLAKLGMRSSETGDLHLSGVHVPGGSGLAPRGEDRGFRAMLELLDFNRLYIAALSIGLARAAFEPSVAWVRERQAFGQPLARHQASGFKVARMSLDIDAASALLERACAARDAGERATRLVSEAKLLATEAAVRVTADALQLHGGLGYVEGHVVERAFRDARVGTIWEGTSEIQQQIICRELSLYEA
ncbi:MAG: acyl-CoA dehydrogenase family protein [Polyangiaceae bacterium]|nr:acyl-CoA dehydrogenase family protein [Polyangiaceae bacterium]